MTPARRAWGWGRRARAAGRARGRSPSTRSPSCSKGSDFKAGLCKTEVSGRGSYSNFFGNSSRAGLLNSCQERGRRADWPPRPGAGQVLEPSPAAPAPRRGTFSFGSPVGSGRCGHPAGWPSLPVPGIGPLSGLRAPWALPTQLCRLLTWRSSPAGLRAVSRGTRGAGGESYPRCAPRR